MELTEINGEEVAYIRGRGRPVGIGLFMENIDSVKRNEKSTIVVFTYNGHKVYLRESGTDYLLMCKAQAPNAYVVISSLERKLAKFLSKGPPRTSQGSAVSCQTLPNTSEA